MFEIDGSQKSGSGTILRLSIALAAITNKPLHIFNIRQNRPQPGLKHQHLEAVFTASKLSNAKLQGATLGSKELWFEPQRIEGGNIEAQIETAGSIPMLLLAVLPICAFAKEKVHLHVAHGGTDTIHAPTINYLRLVLLPTLKKMGIDAEITVQKYGYYPKGGGEVTMIVKPNNSPAPIELINFGRLTQIDGLSVCTFLSERQVAERQAKAAQNYLLQEGYNAKINIFNDESNSRQKGSSIVLRAETDTNVIIGSDSIGQLQKTSEQVGKDAAEKLVNELKVKSTADIFLSDMLIPYMAFSKGKCSILCRKISDHIESNIWLIKEMLGVNFSIEKQNALYMITKS